MSNRESSRTLKLSLASPFLVESYCDSISDQIESVLVDFKDLSKSIVRNEVSKNTLIRAIEELHLVCGAPYDGYPSAPCVDHLLPRRYHVYSRAVQNCSVDSMLFYRVADVKLLAPLEELLKEFSNNSQHEADGCGKEQARARVTTPSERRSGACSNEADASMDPFEKAMERRQRRKNLSPQSGRRGPRMDAHARPDFSDEHSSVPSERRAKKPSIPTPAPAPRRSLPNNVPELALRAYKVLSKIIYRFVRLLTSQITHVIASWCPSSSLLASGKHVGYLFDLDRSEVLLLARGNTGNLCPNPSDLPLSSLSSLATVPRSEQKSRRMVPVSAEEYAPPFADLSNHILEQGSSLSRSCPTSPGQATRSDEFSGVSSRARPEQSELLPHLLSKETERSSSSKVSSSTHARGESIVRSATLSAVELDGKEHTPKEAVHRMREALTASRLEFDRMIHFIASALRNLTQLTEDVADSNVAEMVPVMKLMGRINRELNRFLYVEYTNFFFEVENELLHPINSISHRKYMAGVPRGVFQRIKRQFRPPKNPRGVYTLNNDFSGSFDVDSSVRSDGNASTSEEETLGVNKTSPELRYFGEAEQDGAEDARGPRTSSFNLVRYHLSHSYPYDKRSFSFPLRPDTQTFLSPPTRGLSETSNNTSVERGSSQSVTGASEMARGEQKAIQDVLLINHRLSAVSIKYMFALGKCFYVEESRGSRRKLIWQNKEYTQL